MGARADRRPIKSELYLSGAVVGSFVPFGIGHAIQGRYKEIGWVFTLSELASVAVIAGGLTWATIATSRHYAATKGPSMYIPAGSLALLIAGAIAAGGFRIWEIIDLWVGAAPIEAQKTAALNHQYAPHAMPSGIKQASVMFDLIRCNF